MEKNQRKNNLLVFGINKPIKERSINYFCEEINKLLDISISETDINSLYSLGKLPTSPLKVEFVNYQKKILVFKNSKKLKNTGWIVAGDLTETERTENKYLRSRLNYYRRTTEERCYLKGNILFVGNRSYTIKDLKNLECEDQQAEVGDALDNSTTEEDIEEKVENIEIHSSISKIAPSVSHTHLPKAKQQEKKNSANNPGKKITENTKNQLALINAKGFKEKLRHRTGSTSK